MRLQEFETHMDPEIAAVYEKMSAYEVRDLYYTVRDSTVFVVSTFLSVLFAYLAVAHFAAKKLSLFEILAITVAYSVFAMFLFSGVVGSLISLSNIQEFLNGTRFPIVDVGFPVFLFICWLASLVYMYLECGKGDS